MAVQDLSAHHAQMDSSAEILAALQQRKVTHEQIANVIGINRVNVTRLYKPDPRTGKPRTLTYDEGRMLIETFGLETDDAGSIEPMALPAARLAVQYVAQQLGVKIDPDDGRVEDLALDIRAYSEFAARAQLGDNLERAQGWFDGRQSRSPATA